MKKVLAIVISCSLAACFLLSACGNSGGGAADGGETNFAQELLDEVKDKLEEAKAEVEKEGTLLLNVLAEDKDTIVYEYKVAKEDIEVDVEQAKANIEAMKDSIMTIVEELEKKGSEDAKVVFRFLDKEGKEIYSEIVKK